MSTQKPVVLEMCVDSVESVLAAERGGAQRVELCANLLEGGTTPSLGTIAESIDQAKIKVNVIIRPRGGDFCYSPAEFRVMQRNVQTAKECGANGVVIGILLEDGTIDKPRTKALIDAARPLSVTFHRAYDMTRDPYEALEDLIDVGADRILTSGQENSALEGLGLITSLVERAGVRIIIMPGGGVNDRNIVRILSACRASEVHVHAARQVEGAMRYRNPRAFMGGELRPPEFSLSVTQPNLVRAVRDTLDTAG